MKLTPWPIVAVVVAWSAPSVACDPWGYAPERVIVPFANKIVPRNATLEVFNRFDAGVGRPRLNGPEGEQWLDLGDDGRRIDPVELAVGTYTMTFSTGDGEIHTIPFEVEDRLDEEAPVVRAEVHRESDELRSGPCSVGIPSFSPVRSVSFIDDVDDDLVLVSGLDTAWPIDAGTARVVGYDDLPALTIVDLAGNSGVVELIETGGCANVPAASMSALTGLLLLIRRRRSSSGGDTPPAPKKLARRQSPKRLSLRARS